VTWRLDQLAIADVPEPQLAGPHDVKVRLSAAAFNHLDLWTWPDSRLELTMPHILGGDGAGVVAAVGESGAHRAGRG